VRLGPKIWGAALCTELLVQARRTITVGSLACARSRSIWLDRDVVLEQALFDRKATATTPMMFFIVCNFYLAQQNLASGSPVAPLVASLRPLWTGGGTLYSVTSIEWDTAGSHCVVQ
jgi:hypothetical protein